MRNGVILQLQYLVLHTPSIKKTRLRSGASYIFWVRAGLRDLRMDLAAASLRAGFERPLRVGDTFRTLGPRPCCAEYTDVAPFGDRIGGLPGGTIIEAQEIVVCQRYLSEEALGLAQLRPENGTRFAL